MQRQDIKTFAWGSVTGGVVVAIALFASGWAVTSSSAQKDARMLSQSAVTASLAEICIAQFKGAADKDEKLAALKQLDSWKRGNYVNAQGWATMPGNDSGTSQVAAECADMLTKMQS